MKPSHEHELVLDLNFYRDWIAKRQAARQKDKTRPTVFVTISREFGCEGYALATGLTRRLAERSGAEWNIFTRSMIEEMIGNDDFGRDMVHKVTEERWTFKDWFVDALVPRYLQSQSSKVFQGMRNLILNLADKGNVVVLGAGAQIITHRLDPKKFLGVHVRIAAPYEWRLTRMEGLYGIPRDEAENLLRSQQGSRDEFIRDFSGLDAKDPSLYHLTLNNARNTPEQMVDIVVETLASHGAFDE